jgi:hypothetical protein
MNELPPPDDDELIEQLEKKMKMLPRRPGSAAQAKMIATMKAYRENQDAEALELAREFGDRERTLRTAAGWCTPGATPLGSGVQPKNNFPLEVPLVRK